MAQTKTWIYSMISNCQMNVIDDRQWQGKNPHLYLVIMNTNYYTGSK
jgi:hypothetical protein